MLLRGLVLVDREPPEPLTRWVERERVGLTQRLPLPRWARDAVAVLLLDYTLYLWHVLEHRSPWIYRFHQVHHADLELDVSTAARFHVGEFLASVPWRAAQVAVIGASPRAVAVWQRLTMISVLFHHSNVRLPLAIESERRAGRNRDWCRGVPRAGRRVARAQPGHAVRAASLPPPSRWNDPAAHTGSGTQNADAPLAARPAVCHAVEHDVGR